MNVLLLILLLTGFVFIVIGFVKARQEKSNTASYQKHSLKSKSLPYQYRIFLPKCFIRQVPGLAIALAHFHHRLKYATLINILYHKID